MNLINYSIWIIWLIRANKILGKKNVNKNVLITFLIAYKAIFNGKQNNKNFRKKFKSFLKI